MPKNGKLTRELAEKTEDFVLILLLPVFFAYSSLNNQLGVVGVAISGYTKKIAPMRSG